MSPHRGRGFGTPAAIAAIAGGVSLLVLVAVFVWWVAGGSETESTCDTCRAAEVGDLAGVRSALAARTDPGERSAEATLALVAALSHLEIEGGTEARDIVLALLDAGADPNQFISIARSGLSGRSGRSGNTVSGTGGGTAYVLYAAERAIGLGDTALLDRFLAAGLDVTGKPGGATLTRASAEGQLAVVQRLITEGADVNHRHDDLGSPLAAAVHRRHRDVAALLDQHGAREWQ
jgi:ankyrin repeat protein